MEINYFEMHYTFSVNFCELVLFSLVGSEMVISLSILIFYHFLLWPEVIVTHIKSAFGTPLTFIKPLSQPPAPFIVSLAPSKSVNLKSNK